MGEVAFTSHGKKITIVDNGDNKLGNGDTVRIGDAAARPIDDPTLAEDLRKAGVELANLAGTKIASLARFFDAVEKIHNRGEGEYYENVASAELMARLAGIPPNHSAMRRIYREAFERESENFLHSLNVFYCLPIAASDLKHYKRLQEYAAKAWIDFPSEKASVAAIARWALDMNMKKAEAAKKGSDALIYLEDGRQIATSEGIAFDEQRAAAIVESHRQRECPPPEPYVRRPHSTVLFSSMTTPNSDSTFRTSTERFCRDTQPKSPPKPSKPEVLIGYWPMTM